MKHPTTILAALGLSLAALVPSAHATTTTLYQQQSAGTLTFSALPATVGTDTVLSFIFSPAAGANFAPAELVGSNFQYQGSWQVDTDPFAIFAAGLPSGHYAYTKGTDPTSGSTTVQSISLYNNGTNGTPDTSSGSPTTTQINVPFSSIGSGASFDLTYFDPPASTNFTLQQGSQTLVAGTFAQDGTFTQTGGSATFKPAVPAGGGGTGGTTAAVPEPSSLALMGLGVLPMIGFARRRRALRS